MPKHFTGLRRAARETISLKVTAAMVFGQAVGIAATPTTAAVAAGLNYHGHLAKDVTADGTGVLHQIPGYSDPMFTFPAKVDDYVDVEAWDELEAEGPHLTLASTGALTSGTAQHAKLALVAGKYRVAQTGDYAVATVVQMKTAEDATITDNVRAHIRMLPAAQLI